MSEPHDTPLATYLEAHGGPDPAASDRLGRAMEQAIGRSEPRARARLGWAVAAAVALALPAAWLLLEAPDPGAAQVATMETGEAAQELLLRHGGRATLDRRTQVQVLRNDGGGARLRLLSGAVYMDVHQVDGARWLVEASDYEVVAVGTVFRVEHRGAQVPSVEVTRGVVRMVGPGLPEGGLEIAAPGEPELAQAEPVAPVADAIPPVVPVATDAPTPARELPPAEAVAEPDPRRAKSSAPSWVERFEGAMGAGKLAEAAAALPDRFPRGDTGSLTAADVLDAGDALRSVGESDRALETYRSVCERWSASGSCGVATLRGALLEARRGDRRAAIEGATRYLEREPRGALARDALGRRMQWRNELGDRAGARADATEYLERWPAGSLAATARKLLGD